MPYLYNMLARPVASQYIKCLFKKIIHYSSETTAKRKTATLPLLLCIL